MVPLGPVVMRKERAVSFVPSMQRVMDGHELRSITLGHPLVDAYLEFVGARGAVNTWLATAYDLKVFFEVVGKDPADVTSADVFAFLGQQRTPRQEKVVRIEDGEAGLSARTIARALSGADEPPAWQIGESQMYADDPNPRVRARYAQARELALPRATTM